MDRRLARLLPWAPLALFLALLAVTSVLLLATDEAGSLPLLAVLVAFFVGARSPIGGVVVALVSVEVALVVFLLADVEGFDLGDLVANGVGFAAAIALGWLLQTRQRRIEGFEVEQAEAARRAAAEERQRIAQEIHDVIAHSLGIIAVQANVGLHVIDTDPQEARQALEHISRMSRSSLTDVRWLLGRVRDTEGGPAYRPAPGLSDLGRLAGEVRGAGLDVDLQVDGDVDGVPPGVGLAAYRIVQEALTNAIRHAGADRAEVRVGLDGGAVEVEVVDDGRGGPATPGGHGLVGMQERAAVYGGSVEAGPIPTGGFRVKARLPVAEVAS